MNYTDRNQRVTAVPSRPVQAITTKLHVDEHEWLIYVLQFQHYLSIGQANFVARNSRLLVVRIITYCIVTLFSD